MSPSDYLTLDYLPPDHVGPLYSFVACVAVLGAIVAGAIAYVFLRARELEQAQEREHAFVHDRENAAISPGRARVVHGRVEQDEGAPLFSIEIVQKVRNCADKNSKWHVWEEVSRRVNVAPFYLVREDGTAIYVEPSERVLFVDSLESELPEHMPEHRIRRATVHVGRELHAYGNLFEAPHPRARDGNAYRSGGVGLVLRAPQNERMLLTTDALDDRYVARVRYLRRAAMLFTAMFIVFHAVFTVPFLITLSFGSDEIAPVVATRTYLTHNKNSTTTHYVVEVKAADGFQFEGEVEEGVYGSIKIAHDRGDDVRVPILRVGHSSWLSVLGRDASTPLATYIVGFLLVLLSTMFVLLGYPARFPWYDRKKLSEHGGKGHWVETRRLA